MEWLGINLNHHRQTRWEKRSFRSMFICSLTLCVSILIALLIYVQDGKLKQENRLISTQILQKEQQLSQLTQQIENIKQQTAPTQNSVTIKPDTVSKIVALLYRLPLNGGLTQISLEPNREKPEQLFIELQGTLSPEHFSQLEQQLKQQQHPYKITQLQSDEQHQLIFQLIIEWETS